MSENALLKEKMSFEDKLEIVKYAFVGFGIFLIFLSMIMNKLGGSFRAMTPILLISGFIIAVGPYTLYSYYIYSRSKKMEEFFPTFLRDYSEAISSGLTFSQALEITSRGDYGSLTKELKRASNLLSWGVPFPKVLDKMAKRMGGSKVIKQAFTIIKESYNTGGDVATTMNSVSTSILGIKNIQQERKSILSQQIWIMYIIFYVFLGITVALYKFLIPITDMNLDESVGSLFGSSVQGNVNYCKITAAQPLCQFGGLLGYDPYKKDTYFKTLFLVLSVLQGLFTGLIVGELSEGSAKAGIRHSAILIFSALFVFFVFVG